MSNSWQIIINSIIIYIRATQKRSRSITKGERSDPWKRYGRTATNYVSGRPAAGILCINKHANFEKVPHSNQRKKMIEELAKALAILFFTVLGMLIMLDGAIYRKPVLSSGFVKWVAASAIFLAVWVITLPLKILTETVQWGWEKIFRISPQKTQKKKKRKKKPQGWF